MSAEYNGQEPLDIAKQAERDLNQHSAKWGHDIGPRSNDFGASDSSTCIFPCFCFCNSQSSWLCIC